MIAALLYSSITADETPPHRDWSLWRAGSIGVVALAAWFALLWFMFGDVL